MILVDTSIWVDYFRSGDQLLSYLLDRKQVLGHPFVFGELSLGSSRQRAELVAQLVKLRSAEVARHEEVLRLIDAHALYGRGIGYVDVHLLASAILTPDTQLWSHDRRLNAAAEVLGVAARIAH